MDPLDRNGNGCVVSRRKSFRFKRDAYFFRIVGNRLQVWCWLVCTNTDLTCNYTILHQSHICDSFYSRSSPNQSTPNYPKYRYATLFSVCLPSQLLSSSSFSSTQPHAENDLLLRIAIDKLTENSARTHWHNTVVWQFSSAFPPLMLRSIAHSNSKMVENKFCVAHIRRQRLTFIHSFHSPQHTHTPYHATPLPITMTIASCSLPEKRASWETTCRLCHADDDDTTLHFIFVIPIWITHIRTDMWILFFFSYSAHSSQCTQTHAVLRMIASCDCVCVCMTVENSLSFSNKYKFSRCFHESVRWFSHIDYAQIHERHECRL